MTLAVIKKLKKEIKKLENNIDDNSNLHYALMVEIAKK